MTYAAVFPLVRSGVRQAVRLPPAGCCGASVPGQPRGRASWRHRACSVSWSRCATPRARGPGPGLGRRGRSAAVPTDLLRLAERVRALPLLAPPAASLALVTPPLAAVKLERLHALTAAGEEALRGGETALAGLRTQRGRAPSVPRALAATRLGAPRVPTARHPGGGPSRLLVCGENCPNGQGRASGPLFELLARRGALDERALRQASGLSCPPALTRLIQIQRRRRRATPPRGAPPLPLARSRARQARHRTCAPYAGPAQAQQEALRRPLRDAVGARCCCTASPAAARPRSTSRRRRPCWRAARRCCARARDRPHAADPRARSARASPRRVAVLHSSLSAGERLAAYRAVAARRARIVVGARSAVFAPSSTSGSSSWTRSTTPRTSRRPSRATTRARRALAGGRDRRRARARLGHAVRGVLRPRARCIPT